MKTVYYNFVIPLLLVFFFACTAEVKDTVDTNEGETKEETEIPSLTDRDGNSGYYAISMPNAKRSLAGGGVDQTYVPFNTEDYGLINENGFKAVANEPLSTFSIDVDAASYSNVRRFINNNQMPPKDAVRIEELINYFNYDYPQPEDGNPFSITTEVSECPWNKEHLLVHIGLKGKDIAMENLPPSNIVFLLDVSGSMNSPNKLPLLKKAFKLLVNKLRSNDRVAIVVYAGAAGTALKSTPGNEKKKIIASLDKLFAGGSTAGAEGIQLAYQIAQENFIKNGNNRVILATDGDFNIGPSSDAQMARLIEEEREKGIFLTVLGFGMGNYKDNKMEQLADKGNGNYAYIDNILEAKKVLVNEFGGTLFTIAKDVKIQVEFNPAQVKGYRLIGYENRLLNNEDFNDDKKDAGELGSGHTVTAIYELIPAGSDEEIPGIDPLKYQTVTAGGDTEISDEILTVKFRYKDLDGDKSKLIVKTTSKDDILQFEDTDNNFKFSAAVAEFGMLIRDSEFKGTSNYDEVKSFAEEATGDDKNGYRKEFIRLIEITKLLGEAQASL